MASPSDECKFKILIVLSGVRNSLNGVVLPGLRGQVSKKKMVFDILSQNVIFPQTTCYMTK